MPARWPPMLAIHHVPSEHLLDHSVRTLRLPVTLRMKRRAESQPSAQDTHQRLPELPSEARIAVTHYRDRHTKISNNPVEKETRDLPRTKIVPHTARCDTDQFRQPVNAGEYGIKAA